MHSNAFQSICYNSLKCLENLTYFFPKHQIDMTSLLPHEYNVYTVKNSERLFKIEFKSNLMPYDRKIL